MQDESSIPISGDGEMQEEPVMEPSEGASEKPTREKPLKIKGTLDDVLRAAMRVKPKDEQIKTRHK